MRQANYKNERPIAEAGALQMPAPGRSACPSLVSERRACPSFFLRGIFSSRGQQVIEYAILVTIISVALLSMSQYAARGIQAVVKGSADQIGPQADAFPQQGRDTVEVNTTQDALSSDTSNKKAAGEARNYTYNSSTDVTGGAVTVSVYY